MGFDKYRDDIPLSNARAIVEFWIRDLHLSRKYLKLVMSYESHNFPFYKEVLKIAQNDVKVSEQELENARKKLQETQNRVYKLGK